MLPNPVELPTPPSPALLKYLRAQGLEDQAVELEKKWGLSSDMEKYLGKFITVDPETDNLKNYVRALAIEQDCVLVQGETGTGKELISRALHGYKKGEFIAINCAGMPETLIESELFGYEAGAFTDAKKATDGLIAHANNGTVFLDEIGDLPLALQAKLLRVIQEQEVRRVGGKTAQKVNVRFIAASHFDLQKHVIEGRFRQDLYARLSTFELVIKPLRERRCDIKPIIQSLDKHDTFPVDKVDWSKLELPLNVRDLQRIVRRYQILRILP